ncbi:MAG: WYL domain-containing protein [Nitrososphaera sp.]|nr:WYL domain-containing protein [Nitrososphaera sp.]
MTASEAITQAARALHTVIINYTDQKGAASTREVEPYSWRPGKDPGSIRFFGFDISKSEIRGFRMDRVSLAQVTERTFVPKWVVEI